MNVTIFSLSLFLKIPIDSEPTNGIKTSKFVIENAHPFNFPTSEIATDFNFLNNKISIARPIADSTAATVIIKNHDLTNTITKYSRKTIKLKLTASKINSIAINIKLNFFYLEEFQIFQ